MSSARPALTLIKPVPRPGPAAMEFIAWAVDTFGQPPTPAGVSVVPRSQSDLLAEHDTIDSHGTVTWYMRQLRDAGIVVGARPIAVDLHALAQLTNRPGGRLQPERPGTGSASPTESPGVSQCPGMAELLAQRAEQQARMAQLQAELAITDAAIARVLIDSDTAQEVGPGAREFADPAVAELAKDREFRESGLAIQEGRKVDLDDPPSFLNPWLANRDREPREHSRIGEPAEPGGEPLTVGQVDEIIEPLRSLCRTTGRPDRIDDRGRQVLAQLGREALRTGVENYCPEVSADVGIHRPMNLFIHRARHGDPDTFDRRRTSNPGEPGRASNGATGSGRPSTAQAPEATFESPSPHPLDATGRALAASPVGFAAARQARDAAIAANSPTQEETDS